MPEPCTVRPAVLDDIDAILVIWIRADAIPSATDDAETVGALLGRHPGSVLLAEMNGDPVGTLIVGFDGWRGNMYRLAVVPGHRRLGIASSLVAAGEVRLRDLGAKRISALVVDSEEAASEFWAAQNYEHDTRIARFVKTLESRPVSRGMPNQ